MNWIKAAILISACSFYTGASNIRAQNLEWGPDLKVVQGKSGAFDQIITSNSDGVFGYRKKTGWAAAFGAFDFFICRYDSRNLSMDEVHPLFPKDYFKKGKNEPTAIDSIIVTPNKRFLFFSNYKKKQFSAYVVELDKNFNIITDEPVLLDVVETEGAIRKGDFRIKLSDDQSKVLVYYLSPFKASSAQKFRFKIFDSKNFDLVAERQFNLPHSDKDFLLSDLKITDDDMIYLLAKIYMGKVDEKAKEKDLPNYYYSFYKYDLNDDQEDGEYKIEVPRKFINNMSFKFIDDQIVISGFYGDKNSRDISGIYYSRLNRHTGAVAAEGTYEFTKQFISEFYSEKQQEQADKKNKDLEVPKIQFNELIVGEDGSATIIAEQRYIVSIFGIPDIMKGTVNVTYIYRNNDIIVAHINPKGEIEWTTKVPKKSTHILQTTQNVWVMAAGASRGSAFAPPAPNHLGFTLVESDDAFHFIFNDHVSNSSDAEKTKVLIGAKNCNIVDIAVSKRNGEMTRNVLANMTKSKTYFMPRLSAQIPGTGEVLIYTGGYLGVGSKEKLARYSIGR